LVGFAEESPKQVRANLVIEGETLKSLINGKSLVCGRLETPTLGELRQRVNSSNYKTGRISLKEIVANVQDLHTNESNANALFQVASQFNLLEMVSPNVTPEEGVGIYQYDRTQGPACAVAAGAGTIYRNYFARVNGQLGQTANNQIDCLAELGAALGNDRHRLWTMKNGYVFPTHEGLVEIAELLRTSRESERDELRKLLRIGIQWNVGVTLNNCQHRVSQAYCSALPVGYSSYSANLWAEFARFILEAAYEATICTAILNSINNGSNKLFLTLLGGGVFANSTDWIFAAIKRALNLYKNVDLDVAIVSYGSSKIALENLL
jgi:hypothetical protein